MHARRRLHRKRCHKREVGLLRQLVEGFSAQDTQDRAREREDEQFGTAIWDPMTTTRGAFERLYRTN